MSVFAHPPASQDHRSEIRSFRVFLVSASLAVALCISGGFLGMAVKQRQLIREEMLNRARRDFANIVLMRQWNANYGGVYAEKKPGVVSNPYLEHPDLTATDGRVFTKKNPALMTRELSELIQKDQGYAFHITSLNPLNPHNGPDGLERAALEAFAQGARERFWIEPLQGVETYRYMAPLLVEASCLTCHAKQGYRVGDIRGGISVSFRVSELQAQLHQNMALVVTLATLTTLLLLGAIYFLFRQLVRRLKEARAQLEYLAASDALTGLANRRSIMQALDEELERHQRSGEPFSCTLLDVDHFKLVNDTYGHLVGDAVLRQIALQLKVTLRTYDRVGRYGGEEFLCLLPGADLATARVAAERLREAIHAKVTSGQGEKISASFGIAWWQPDEDATQLLARADQAMYRAKMDGRNRVEG